MGRKLRDLPDLGLDYAMVITFIGIVVPFIVNRPMLMCAMVSGTVSMFTIDVPNKMGLMVAAVCGIVAAMISEWWSQKTRQDDARAERL